MSKRLSLALCLILFLVASPSFAIKYIRDGASGSTCADWGSNACDTVSSWTASETYYFADGSYSVPDVNQSGVTIYKATVASHGTSTGWLDSYGDGQAAFGSFWLAADNFTIDGRTRNSANWGDYAAYGIKITGGDGYAVFKSSTSDFGMCADNVTLRYVNIGGVEGSSYTDSEPTEALYIGGFSETCTNWTVQYSYFHNISHFTLFQLAGVNGMTIEYNLLKNGWGKEAIRGGNNNITKNVIIRHNKFENACGNTGEYGGGCTAEIGIWGAQNAGDMDNNEIYGNLFVRTVAGEYNTGGTIVVGGDGSTWLGPAASNTKVYNNTIYGVDGTNGVGGDIIVNGGSGNVCRNNLHYDSYSHAVNCTTTSNNVNASSNPFVSIGSNNFHLTAESSVLSGYALSSPYNTDMDGVTRGSGSYFEIGAYEYDSGGGDSTAPTGSFDLPASYGSLTVPISTFTCSDETALAASPYCVTTTNSSSGCSWEASAPTTITFTGAAGSKTGYAWCKDLAGNISTGLSDSTTISFLPAIVTGVSILNGTINP